MSLRRRALARFLALPALLAGRRAAAAPAAAPLADAYSREIRKSEPQRLPAVYHHWEIDPDTWIITHTPTALSFKVYRKPARGSSYDLFARLVAGTPRSESELLDVADMGINWFNVFAYARVAHLKALREKD